MSELNYGELLSAYLDGEVEGEELNRVNLLLASSAEARQELERLQETKHVLGGATRLAAPPDLVALLLANPKLQERHRTSWWQSLIPQSTPRWAWATAGAMVIAIGSYVTVTAPWASQPLPLSALLAAHARQQIDGSIHDTLVAASNYSSLLASQNAPQS